MTFKEWLKKQGIIEASLTTHQRIMLQSVFNKTDIPRLGEQPQINAGCEVEFMRAQVVEGEEGKLPTFTMNAYNGGVMNLGWWGPTVVELRGMKITKKSRPILRDHSQQKVVGHSTKITKDLSTLTVEGIISGTGADAEEVVTSSLNEFPWQSSIGAWPRRMEWVEKGVKVKVNGQQFVGPIYVARQTDLGEVSFVALGADDTTSAMVAASANNDGSILESENMDEFKEWLKAMQLDYDKLSEEQRTALQAKFDVEQAVPAPSAAPTPAPTPVAPPVQASTEPAAPAAPISIEAYREEIQRVNAIEALCGDHEEFKELKATAVKDGHTVDSVELITLRAGRGQAPAMIVKAEKFNANVIEAAICIDHNLVDLDKKFDEKTLNAADERRYRNIGPQELLMLAAGRNGYSDRRFQASNIHEMLQAAFSTTDLSGILSNIGNKFMVAGFESIEQAFVEISSVRNVKDFKAYTSYRMTDDMEYEEVGPDGELEHGELGETAYTNQAKTYGKMIGITRKDIINDDLGAFTALPKKIGRGGALKLNTVFWTRFMNNAAFFAAGNNNYEAGADTVLGIGGLTKAEILFNDQTDEHGKPVSITPQILLVPNALSVTGNNLFNSTIINAATSTTVGAATEGQNNPHAGKYKVVRSSYLGNAQIPGNSVLAYYLLANPQDIPTIEIAYLDGVRRPTIETARAAFNKLGIESRGVFDFGVQLQEFRGGVKMKGSA